MNTTSPACTCPVSRLPILAKPEWNKVEFGNEYKISAEIIGEQILVTHNSGTPTLHDIQNAMNFTSYIIDNFLPGKPYVHIFDYSGIRQNVSLANRRVVIKTLVQRKQMQAAIFYGLTPSLKLSIQIGRFFNHLPFTCLITQDYAEALESAIAILAHREQHLLLPEERKALDQEETSKLLAELSQNLLTPERGDFEPFERALDLIEDEIRYLEEQEGISRHQETMTRLGKIISSRNEKARIYRNSLRPNQLFDSPAQSLRGES
ncbi:MAG: hypothetical protein JXR80_00475 [Deltaproteobacteria bacterium]|nr:hypothetical protein [Deltaproteobacteria bacterium]